jgi:hypothetical protein
MPHALLQLRSYSQFSVTIRANTHPDITHNCWGYRLGHYMASLCSVERSSCEETAPLIRVAFPSSFLSLGATFRKLRV